jgi:glycosyltransferase involved in cell wall biosynthesis
LNRHAGIIQTYKVRQNIGLLAEEILKLGLDSQVIVVDDTSPDGTGELADDLAGQHSGVRVIHRPGKLGLGTAHIAGMKAALSASARTIRTMDADFSHHPRYLPGLLAALEQFDVVIDSRCVPGGGTLYWRDSVRFLCARSVGDDGGSPGALQGVLLATGEHEVRFGHKPVGWGVGWPLSLAALSFPIGIWILVSPDAFGRYGFSPTVPET